MELILRPHNATGSTHPIKKSSPPPLITPWLQLLHVSCAFAANISEFTTLPLSSKYSKKFCTRSCIGCGCELQFLQCETNHAAKKRNGVFKFAKHGHVAVVAWNRGAILKRSCETQMNGDVGNMNCITSPRRSPASFATPVMFINNRGTSGPTLCGSSPTQAIPSRV